MLLSQLLKDADFTIGVFAGGMLVIINLFVLDKALQKAMKGKGKDGGGMSPAVPAVLMLKSMVLYGAVVGIVYYLKVNGIGFLVGISIVFVSLAIKYFIGSEKQL